MLPSNVRCRVVEVFEPGQTMEHDRFSSRDLLPWADPYIAQLLAMHQVQLAVEPWDEEWEVPFALQRRLSGYVSGEASPPFDPFRRPQDESFRRDRWSSDD